MLQRDTAPGCSGLKPRERIVVTARDLFHRHGIKTVGVDTIAEVAGTNKMTLYRHFGSKDDLIVACLREAAEEMVSFWDEIEAAHPGDAQAQLRAWIREGADCIESDERGCELANAAVELAEENHPARRLVEECKKKHRVRLAQVCANADLDQPELVADTLWLLLEGARLSRQSDGAEGPSARFVRMAEGIVASFGKRG
jgi:AcrR family transcriptional regulator